MWYIFIWSYVPKQSRKRVIVSESNSDEDEIDTNGVKQVYPVQQILQSP